VDLDIHIHPSSGGAQGMLDLNQQVILRYGANHSSGSEVNCGLGDPAYVELVSQIWEFHGFQGFGLDERAL
jgi:hypothetical protein